MYFVRLNGSWAPGFWFRLSEFICHQSLCECEVGGCAESLCLGWPMGIHTTPFSEIWKSWPCGRALDMQRGHSPAHRSVTPQTRVSCKAPCKKERLGDADGCRGILLWEDRKGRGLLKMWAQHSYRYHVEKMKWELKWTSFLGLYREFSNVPEHFCLMWLL